MAQRRQEIEAFVRNLIVEVEAAEAAGMTAPFCFGYHTRVTDRRSRTAPQPGDVRDNRGAGRELDNVRYGSCVDIPRHGQKRTFDVATVFSL